MAMLLDSDCIFCPIIRGEVPSFRVFEDERTLAFMDIKPPNPGHPLVVPTVSHRDHLHARGSLAHGDDAGRTTRRPSGPEGVSASWPQHRPGERPRRGAV